MTTDVMTASRPSAGILAEMEARAVDAPTEDGDWCAVDERGVYSPVKIEISTWTEVVDEYGDSIDEDDPVAVGRGQKVQRSEVRVYDPGVEVARDLPCGMRWVRFEALIGTFAQVTAERDALRAIVDGRTTPPTWQEIERHHESGGSWTFSVGGSADVSEHASVTHRWADDHRAHPDMDGCRWWALDAHRRPCAWPVVDR